LRKIGAAYGVAIARRPRKGRNVAIGENRFGKNAASGVEQIDQFAVPRRNLRRLFLDYTARILKTQNRRFHGDRHSKIIPRKKIDLGPSPSRPSRQFFAAFAVKACDRKDR
jgi:hypothetical protein